MEQPSEGVRIPDTQSSQATSQATSTFEQFLEFVPDAIVGATADGSIVLVNRQAETLFGYSRDELLGRPLEILVPRRFQESHPGHRATYFSEPGTRPMGAGRELAAVRKDGSEFPAEISLSSIEMEQGVVAAAAVRDISERAESEREKALQEQLNRARRLESVGQLAGGIAHDFNNLLGVIINYSSFVAEDLPESSQAREDLAEIKKAAERGASLTRQLLIFSRRDTARPEVLDLAQVAAELENLLEKALGERVEMKTVFAEDLWPIAADPGQMGQVLVNLAVNARDAMPGGGQLVIEGGNIRLDEEYGELHPDTPAGDYVRLMVSDTGVGMDRDVAERAFEPFFTTKDKAKGTGLGLATVYGIVTQSGGRVDLYSEPGMGTTIKIHLPASSEAPRTAAAEPAGPRSGQGEVILVVEDEPDVRSMTERILSKGGYGVIGRSDGEAALELCEAPEQSIDLLLTDVVMPGMLGTELVQRITEIRPDLPVIYMSGYSHEVLAASRFGEESGAAFIEKPFNSRQLLEMVGGRLDG